MLKKGGCLLWLLMLIFLIAAGQKENNIYKNGYLLKGGDTIPCKIKFNSKYTDARKAVSVLINDEEVTFYTGGTITGFGVEDAAEKYEYGILDVEILVGNRRVSNNFFVRKIVAGTIDLYEYNYTLFSTKRTTVNGEEKPGSASSSSKNYSDLYIAKKDTAAPVLATPVLFSSFRKKELEPYISDKADLFVSAKNRFSLKELIALLKEYNSSNKQ